MLNKLYEEIKEIIIDNYKMILSFFVILAIFTMKLPYYVDAPGGLINVSSKIEMSENYTSKGSFNLSYVSEYKGTIPILLLAGLKKDWHILKEEELVLENETLEESNFRNRLLLTESNNNAIMIAYQKALKEVSISNQELYITYVDPEAKTDLKCKDKVLEIEGIPVKNKADFQAVLKDKVIGDKVSFTVERNDDIYESFATIYEIEGRRVAGVVLTENKVLSLKPSLTLSFDKSESGPSGGLMMSLAIYDALIEDDMTHGYTIVGTGTMENDGTVGEVGGIEYKIKGALKKNADIFLVPAGENYEDAKAILASTNKKMELVSISTFEEAIQYLNTLKEKQ